MVFPVTEAPFQIENIFSSEIDVAEPYDRTVASA